MAFPTTRHSVVRDVASPDRETRRRAQEVLVQAYWRPVYHHLRCRWQREPADAEDLTQEFFSAALEKDYFLGFDAERARFRTFLKVCLDRFASNRRRAELRLKRGGGLEAVGLDFAEAEMGVGRQLAAGPDEGDSGFDREWVRSVFQLAVADLRGWGAGSGKAVQVALLERYDLHDDPDRPRPTYAELAEAFDLPVTQVTNYLAAARRELKRLLLERVRALTATEAEFREELRALLGRDPA